MLGCEAMDPRNLFPTAEQREACTRGLQLRAIRASLHQRLGVNWERSEVCHRALREAEATLAMNGLQPADVFAHHDYNLEDGSASEGEPEDAVAPYLAPWEPHHPAEAPVPEPTALGLRRNQIFLSFVVASALLGVFLVWVMGTASAPAPPPSMSRLFTSDRSFLRWLDWLFTLPDRLEWFCLLAWWALGSWAYYSSAAAASILLFYVAATVLFKKR